MKRRAFTLIELLTAMAILIVMLTLLSGMVEVVSNAWKTGAARADNLKQTRVVLGLIERDIQGIVLRPDLAAFCDGRNEPCLAFYTRFAGGGGNDRSLSLVQYALDSSSGSPQLLRYDNGGFAYATASRPELQFVESGTASLADLPQSPLSTASQNSMAVPDGSDQAQILVNGIVGFKIQFLSGDGTIRNNYQFDYKNPAHGENTRTVIVSLVVLDTSAYQLAAKSNAFTALATGLGGTPLSGETFAQYWNELIDAPSFGTSLPKPVRAGLRVFERRIAIPLPLEFGR